MSDRNPNNERRIVRVKKRLVELEDEKRKLTAELDRLQTDKPTPGPTSVPGTELRSFSTLAPD